MDVISVNGNDVVLYHYTPSGPAAWAFVVLFSVATVAHIIMAMPLRSWFMLPLIIGGVCEAGGYYGRAWSSDEPKNFKAFVLQVLLILAAPPFLAASIYMAFGRITRALDTEGHFRRTGLVTKFYVILDILIFLSQIGGAGIQVTGDPDVMRAGRIAIVAGLSFQLLAFIVFVWLVSRVHRWVKDTSSMKLAGLHWRRYFWALYIVSAAIFVRGIIRVVEYAEGVQGEIAKREVYIYVFDAGLMLLVMVVLLCYHPGLILRRLRLGQDKEYSSMLLP